MDAGLPAGPVPFLWGDKTTVGAINRSACARPARLDEFITTYQDLPAEQFDERLLNEVLAWPANGSTSAQMTSL